VAAECLFDREYRVGSSLDEVIFAVVAVHNAAVKIQCDAEKLWFETCNDVATTLKVNEEIVRQIARELMQKNVIKSKRLEHLLRGGTSQKAQ
jgi:hypothetical protein